MPRGVLTLCAAALFVSVLGAQTTAKKTPEQLKASLEAHRGEFDYLLGDWEFTAENREYGKLHGYWSALRMPGGQILDEYRVVGDKGETYYVTSTIRAYNAVLDRWELVSTGDGGGLQDIGTGRKEGGEMRIEQRFGVMSPQPSTWRIRYFNIQADRFSWQGDRSTDDGKTWTSPYQTIEAHRIGPPRSMEPLAPARKPGPSQ